MSDLEGRCFVKRGGVLVPADFAADEFLSSLDDGREIILTVRRPRSPQHHRWFFAMLRLVVENTEHWLDEDDLLDDLKDAVGMARRRTNPLTGNETTRSRSIAFAAMSEDKFTRFRKRCCYVLATFLGWSPETLMDETDATQKPLPPERRLRPPVRHRDGARTPSPAPQRKAGAA